MNYANRILSTLVFREQGDLVSIGFAGFNYLRDALAPCLDESCGMEYHGKSLVAPYRMVLLEPEFAT